MKDKLEQIFDKHTEGYTVYNKDEIIKELLVLFGVVGRSEQLVCPHQATRTPNEEKTGKCRQCGRDIKAN